MEDKTKILLPAVRTRLEGYNREAMMHTVLGIAAIFLGVALFAFLWVEYRVDESELISQLAGGAITLVTIGAGGILGTKVLSLRNAIRRGEEWLTLYKDAIGPPPDKLLDQIEGKILSWLEG